MDITDEQQRCALVPKAVGNTAPVSFLVILVENGIPRTNHQPSGVLNIA
jgi:hypothetical protein